MTKEDTHRPRVIIHNSPLVGEGLVGDVAIPLVVPRGIALPPSTASSLWFAVRRNTGPSPPLVAEPRRGPTPKRRAMGTSAQAYPSWFGVQNKLDCSIDKRAGMC